jgi:hypothetical protein
MNIEMEMVWKEAALAFPCDAEDDHVQSRVC